jgi:hypothetical protein
LSTFKTNDAGMSSSRKKLMVEGSVYRFIAGFVVVLIPILAIAILPLVLILIITVIFFC